MGSGSRSERHSICRDYPYHISRLEPQVSCDRLRDGQQGVEADVVDTSSTSKYC